MGTRFYRYDDLCDMGIVNNWMTLSRLIKNKGFPRPVPFSASLKAYPVDEVEAWLAEKTASREAHTSQVGKLH